MTISLTFNAPTVPDQVEVTYGRLRVPFKVPSSSGSADLIPPVVTLVSPLVAQLEAETPIVVDITDNLGIGRIFLVADMPGSGREELVYRGDRFTSQYAARSTQASIPGGVRLTIRRSSGWPSSPTLVAYAVDLSGNTE